MTKLDAAFWSQRYQENNTGWDIGYPSTPLKEFIDQLNNKDISILIPGAGNAYEAGYLLEQGFKNVHVVDLAQEPLDRFKASYPKMPDNQLIKGNFFDHIGQYDLVFEQTFFCAIEPELRPKYASKMKDLLAPNGQLVGVMFDFPLTEKGPPFGGSEAEYRSTLEKYLTIDKLEACHNSIKPRAGSELFLIARNTAHSSQIQPCKLDLQSR